MVSAELAGLGWLAGRLGELKQTGTEMLDLGVFWG